MLYTGTSEDVDFIYLYSGNVSSALIAMFHDPAVAPTAPQSLPIHITAIPLKPFDTLRDRVIALVLSATSLEDVGKTEDLIVYE